MKLGEGGEAFFVFETLDDIPKNLQTSPVVSPASSPRETVADTSLSSTLPEPDFLDLAMNENIDQPTFSITQARPGMVIENRAQSEMGLSDTGSLNRLLD